MSNFGHQNVCILNYGKDILKTNILWEGLSPNLKKNHRQFPNKVWYNQYTSNVQS